MILLWHTPTDCTAAPEQEPSCDKLGIEPSSSSSCRRESSPGAIHTPRPREQFPNAVTKMDSAQGLCTAASHTVPYPTAQHKTCKVPKANCSETEPARCPKPTAQKQKLQCFSRLPQSLMEVGQSMIVMPKSPLIDQAVTVVGTHCPVVSNNSSMSSPAGSVCPKLDSSAHLPLLGD